MITILCHILFDMHDSDPKIFIAMKSKVPKNKNNIKKLLGLWGGLLCAHLLYECVVK